MNMKEFQVLLTNGQVINVYAYSKSDIGDLLERNGHDRHEIADTYMVDDNPVEAMGEKNPFISQDSMDLEPYADDFRFDLEDAWELADAA